MSDAVQINRHRASHGDPVFESHSQEGGTCQINEGGSGAPGKREAEQNAYLQVFTIPIGFNKIFKYGENRLEPLSSWKGTLSFSASLRQNPR